MKLWRHPWLIVTATLAALLLIAVLAERGLPTDDDHALRDVQQRTSDLLLAESRFREAILRARYGSDPNYDPINREQARIREHLAELEKLDIPPPLKNALTDYRALVLHEVDRAESFKSLNAVVHNSLRYYFHEVKRLQASLFEASSSDKLRKELADFSIVTLEQALGTDASLAPGRLADVERIVDGASRVLPSERDAFERLVRHARIIDQRLPDLAAATTELTHSKSQAQLIRIQALTAEALSVQVRKILFQRILLASLAFVLLVVLGALSRRYLRSLHAEAVQQRFLQVLTDNVGVGVLAVGSDGRISFANPEAERLLGCDRGALLGLNAREHLCVPEGDAAVGRGPCDICEAPGVSCDHASETLFRRRDGQLIPVSQHCAVCERDDGKGVIVTFQDIGERKRIEGVLRRQSAALDAAANAIAIMDTQGNVIWVNAASSALTGYAITESLGKKLCDIAGCTQDDSHLAAMREAMLAGQVWHGEMVNRRKDGTLYPVEQTVTPIPDDDGETKYCIAIMQDITERKQAEEQLRKLAQALEQTPESIVITNLNAEIEYVNAAFERNTGYRREEAIRSNPNMLNSGRTPPETYAALWDALSHGQTWKGEFNNRRKDGSEYTELASISPIRQADGRISHYVAVKEDITDRKRVEAERRIAATAFESQLGMVVTDAHNTILRVNFAFTEITGYGAEEVVGRKTNLLKSGRHDAAFYQAMWETIGGAGSWQGEVWNRRKNGEVYPEWLTITAVKAETGEVTHYVATLADITQRKAADDEIKHLAFFDPLTHLPNRRLLLNRLEKALAVSARTHRKGALLFIDLDNFKTLNDTRGHDIGDLLLQGVAQRLTACIREGDTVARLGGDEFVVMLEDLGESAQETAARAKTVAQKILESLNQPYELDGHRHHSTPSIGATLFTEHQSSVDELLKRADLAMYQAKAAGRNTLRFFDPEMQAAVTFRAALEADLRQGLEENQFILYYQAQVDQHGRITGAEALLRWQHPQRGLISPDDFIPLAEETGIILPLGHWVLEAACARLASWATRPEFAGLVLAINVSARQFHDADFVAQVLSVLDRSGADPKKLKLELTESLLLGDTEDVIAKMNALKARGVGFALDDFGTGYSSLSYLKRLPLDQLKIDRSFIRDILTDANDGAIAGTIVTLAQSMGLEVIAEGVETVKQKEFLAHIDCNAYQGFLFARPQPAEVFERRLTHPAELVEGAHGC
jgi:diguanylate cyclase (GGDEF)-like protein/PAS domain S-box-containing protein